MMQVKVVTKLKEAQKAEEVLKDFYSEDSFIQDDICISYYKDNEPENLADIMEMLLYKGNIKDYDVRLVNGD